MERFEDAGLTFGFDTDSCVADLEHELFPWLNERILILPLSGVNFTALLIRFQNTC